ncbi:hypothetical protein LA080_009242 [Diaporthe eres]|nr:hypothetical protein LA080_009242 [Diaporthe eres]
MQLIGVRIPRYDRGQNDHMLRKPTSELPATTKFDGEASSLGIREVGLEMESATQDRGTLYERQSQHNTRCSFQQLDMNILAI